MLKPALHKGADVIAVDVLIGALAERVVPAREHRDIIVDTRGLDALDD
jgi:hypothetical protein